jgi:hypothetical protein
VTAAALADTRPRADYLLPSGEFVAIIRDHDETPAPTCTYAIKGEIVMATLAPIQRSDVEWLLAYACRPAAVDQRLRYLAYAALGAGDSRYAFERVPSEDRHSAIRCCADELQMIRLISAPVRGSVRP